MQLWVARPGICLVPRSLLWVLSPRYAFRAPLWTRLLLLWPRLPASALNGGSIGLDLWVGCERLLMQAGGNSHYTGAVSISYK